MAKIFETRKEFVMYEMKHSPRPNHTKCFYFKSWLNPINLKDDDDSEKYFICVCAVCIRNTENIASSFNLAAFHAAHTDLTFRVQLALPCCSIVIGWDIDFCFRCKI